MRKSKYYHRTNLLELTTGKKFSNSTTNKIMLLFKNISPEKKEETAKKLYPIVENSKTEEEAYEKAKAICAEMAK